MDVVIAWATCHQFCVNGIRLVLLALSTTAGANAKTMDNANNTSLTPPQNGRYCDQTLIDGLAAVVISP